MTHSWHFLSWPPISAENFLGQHPEFRQTGGPQMRREPRKRQRNRNVESRSAFLTEILRHTPREFAILRVCAPLAQLDRAFGYEPKGREFESLRARHPLPPSALLFLILFLRYCRDRSCPPSAALPVQVKPLPVEPTRLSFPARGWLSVPGAGRRTVRKASSPGRCRCHAETE